MINMKTVICVGMVCQMFPLFALANRVTATIAYCHKTPVIDGKINNEEWQNATALSNLQKNSDGTPDPYTMVYLMADDRTLYVAVQCFENNPAGPQGVVRTHDDWVFEDDSIQVFVSPEDMRKAKEVKNSFGGYEGSFDAWYTDIKEYYEFTVNCKGSTTEAWNDVRDWNAPWSAKVGEEKGAWTVEMAIPFSSMGVNILPDNSLWGFNLIRNRQSHLSGWAGSNYGGYTPLPLGAVFFGNPSLVVRQGQVTKVHSGQNEMAMEVINTGEQPSNVEVTVTEPGGRLSSQVVKVPPLSRQMIRTEYCVKGTGNQTVEYRIKAKNQNIPLLAGQVSVSIPLNQELWLRFFSVPAQVWGDVHLGPQSSATRAVMTLRSANGDTARTQADLTGTGGTTLKLPVKGKEGDKVSAHLEVFSVGGQRIDERNLEAVIPPTYAWQGTKVGLPLTVLPPWTPIEVDGQTIRMLGKSFQYKDFALPAGMVSAGRQILAEPIRLAVRNEETELRWPNREWKILEKDGLHVKSESIWRGEKFDLTVVSDLEYDGFCWTEATLTPHGTQQVQEVALEIPLNKENGKYMCPGNSQAGRAISPVGYRGPFPLGWSLWVGDEERGLAWLAESGEWIRSSDATQQIEIIPESSEQLWRCRFIDTWTTLDRPYTMRFALHLTPSKPISLRKNRIYHPMAEFDLPYAKDPCTLAIPAEGNFDPTQGTFECWVRPVFDTQEKYDTKKDVSVYNRQLMTIVSEKGESFILYYNATQRNFVALIKNSSGSYPVILASGEGVLPAKTWSYLAISWGNSIRLNVNGKVTESKYPGLLTGDVSKSQVNYLITDFSLGDVRISKTPRPLTAVPDGGLSGDGQTLVFMGGVHPLDKSAIEAKGIVAKNCKEVPGKYGVAIAADDSALRIDTLAKQGFKVVTFHENWSPMEGYPDMSRVRELKAVADACHTRGMRFTLYFNQQISSLAPEWKSMKSDFDIYYSWGRETFGYHRDYDFVQDGYTSCVNGPYGELLLDGIARLADQAGIDGVYMDGTTVPWPCSNPTHPGCGVSKGDGTYDCHIPIRGVRQFMKRLRNIFVQRGKDVFLSSHTGGGINIASDSFCDAYLDGESLAGRYKKGFRLTPDTFMAAYMGKQYGYRGEFLPRIYTADEALAVSLVHDTETRFQPVEVTLAWLDYQDDQTRFIPYWERSDIYAVSPKEILGSVYLKKDKALIVLGSQTEKTVDCKINVEGLLKILPERMEVHDAISGERLEVGEKTLSLKFPPRHWRMIEIRSVR